MKLKSLFVLLFALSFTFFAKAQNYPNRPLFGTAPNQDNTGRALTYYLNYISDTAGSVPDTLTIVPNGYDMTVVCTLTDSAVIAIKSKGTSFTASRITVIIENTAGSGHFLNFLGYSKLPSQWIVSSSGTKLSPASGKRAIARFVCDGTAWVEEYRYTQP